MTSADTDYFNQIAETWARVAGPEPGLVQHLLDPKEYPSNARILDVGCGTGHFLSEMLPFLGTEARCHALDPAQRMLATARRNINDPRVTFHDLAIEDYAGPDGPFDRIWFIRVLHHLEDPKTVLDRAASWLAPGGMIQILHQQGGPDAVPRERIAGWLSDLRIKKGGHVVEAGADTWVTFSWSFSESNRNLDQD